jgi:hypothetical protein
MPRPLPAFGTSFCAHVDRMLDVCVSIENARLLSGAAEPIRRELNHVRLAHLYEAVYLRIFSLWEVFLEETCVRYMLGYQSPTHSPRVLIGGIATISDAKSHLYGGRDYILWHNPTTVVSRVQTRLDASPIETVISSSTTILKDMAAVRHRIAHDSLDARSRFDSATMQLAGRRYPGGRPGRFLRDTVPAGQRWLPELGARLKGLAMQMAP